MAHFGPPRAGRSRSQGHKPLFMSSLRHYWPFECLHDFRPLRNLPLGSGLTPPVRDWRRAELVFQGPAAPNSSPPEPPASPFPAGDWNSLPYIAPSALIAPFLQETSTNGQSNIQQARLRFIRPSRFGGQRWDPSRSSSSASGRFPSVQLKSSELRQQLNCHDAEYLME